MPTGHYRTKVSYRAVASIHRSWAASGGNFAGEVPDQAVFRNSRAVQAATGVARGSSVDLSLRKASPLIARVTEKRFSV
jgi:hypothetical protein